MANGKEAMTREKLTDDDIQSVCVNSLQNSLGAPDSDIGMARERNLRAYNAEAFGDFAPPEVEDRSDFVSTDVADTVEGMLPQVMRMFVASDDAVEFEDKSPKAEPEGKLATAYVNHLFYTRNDGVGVIYDWFKDALLQKVGFVKVWAEEESEDSKQTYEGQSEEQLVMLLQDGYTLDGDPQVDEEGALTFTVTKEARSLRIKCAVCPPYEIRVDSNARYGDEPAMIAHIFRKRAFELIEEGYDLSGIGPSDALDYDSEALEMLGPDQEQNSYEAPHESHRTYECAEVYVRLDRDGDGIAEWLKCYLIENQLQDVEQVDGHPFVWICPIPRPHAFFGDCPADFAYQAQVLNTRTIRAIQDNMYLTVNQRTYINTLADVNMDDFVDNRPGGGVRGKGPGSEALMPLVQPALGAPAYQFLETINDWKETRTGFTRYSQGTDADSLNKTATGVSIITQKSDMRIELMARFFAVGMKQLFAKMLKLAIQHQKQAEMIAINGQFVPINPSEWRDQFNVKIKVGLGTGSKEQQAARIMALAQIQNMGVQAGIVQPKHLAETIRLFVEANEFKNPERFVDAEPSGMPPNPEAYQQEKQGIEEQMGKMQEELQRLSEENEGLKEQARSKEGDLAIKAAELGLKEQELAFKAADSAAKLDLQAQSAQLAERESHWKGAESAQKLSQSAEADSVVAELGERVVAIEDVLQQILASMQPREAT
jgi:hypothetical protein